MYNKVDIAKLLLKNNADATIKDNSGKIAFDYAHEKSNNELIRLLSV